MSQTQTTYDDDRLAAFMDKAIGDLSGTMATVLAFLGDRLELFGALADARPGDERRVGDARRRE